MYLGGRGEGAQGLGHGRALARDGRSFGRTDGRSDVRSFGRTDGNSTTTPTKTTTTTTESLNWVKLILGAQRFFDHWSGKQRGKETKREIKRAREK